MPNMNAAVKMAKEQAGKIVSSYLKSVHPKLPKNHEELVSMLRDRARSNELWLLGAIEDHEGYEGFRNWIEDILMESGFYKRTENGTVIPGE